jgi:hypothetical protein
MSNAVILFLATCLPLFFLYGVTLPPGPEMLVRSNQVVMLAGCKHTRLDTDSG